MKTVVVFQSNAFNTSEPEPGFINPESFGVDVARWVIERLRAAGVLVDSEPAQEDFGWYFDFVVDSAAHCFVISSRPSDDGGFEWIGWLERSRGLLGSALGFRTRGILPLAVQTLHAALSDAPEVSGILWHAKSSFDRADETHGSPTP